ncbi:MAG TPA: DUF4932 domain-containing protein [Gemmatimonadaceae bacterium]|nr:DUF4932 domain-containing protein [Gemmatimonadaceae bacterium]
MRSSLILLVAAVSAGGPVSAQEVRVKVDSSAEILAIMFRVAGAPEYSMGRIQPYMRQVDSAFKPFADHPAIREIRRLRLANGVSFDAVMSMAAHLTDPLTFTERAPFDDPGSTLDGRWKGADSRVFLRLARDFARDARVSDFLARQRPVYDSAAVRLQRMIDRRANMKWFSGFFGANAGGVFVASPLLANAGGNFGPRFADGGTFEMHAYLGIGTADSAGFPTIPDGLLSTIVHEFNHSFVNRVVETRSAELRAPGERVYRTVAATMRSQAYGSAQTMLNESIVRASVIRYLLANEGQAAAERETRAQRALGFMWMPQLVTLLGEYEADRATYPSLEAFMPKVVEFYQALGSRIDSETAAFEAARPAIVHISIPDSAKDVDPSTTTITVRFDQPMGPGVSINRIDAEMPGVTSWAFDSTRTVLTLTVKLEPARTYGLRFTGNGFASATGFPLKERSVRFTTR